MEHSELHVTSSGVPSPAPAPAPAGRVRRVFVTGTEGSGIDAVQRRLRAAGWETVDCGTSDDGCAARAHPDACPAVTSVDVIVAVRQHPLPHLTRQERRLECVLLHEVPLVVAGSTVLNPYGARATALVDDLDDIVEACESCVLVLP